MIYHILISYHDMIYFYVIFLEVANIKKIIFLEATTEMSAEELKSWHNDFILMSDNGKLNQRKFVEAFVQLGG